MQLSLSSNDLLENMDDWSCPGRVDLFAPTEGNSFDEIMETLIEVKNSSFKKNPATESGVDGMTEVCHE